MMEVARRAVRDGAPVGIELLFTTCEELALAARRRSTSAQLRADFGFVFDHATPIGELIVAAPTYYRIDARFHGHAAHAGIRPRTGATRSRPRRPASRRSTSAGSTRRPPPTSA